MTSSPGPNSTPELGSRHKEDFSLCEITPVTLDMIQVDDIISTSGVSAKVYPSSVQDVNQEVEGQGRLHLLASMLHV